MRAHEETKRWIVLVRFRDQFGELYPGDLPPYERIRAWRNLRALQSSGRVEPYYGDEPEDANLTPQTEYAGHPDGVEDVALALTVRPRSDFE